MKGPIGTSIVAVLGSSSRRACTRVSRSVCGVAETLGMIRRWRNRGYRLRGF